MKKFYRLMLQQKYLPLLFFLASVFLFVIIIKKYPVLWSMPDLQMYYKAGKEVLSGRNVYLFGHTYADFLYTPFTALLFSFTAYFSITWFKFFIIILSFLSFVLSIWISLGLLGYKDYDKRLRLTLFASGVLLWLEPVQQTLTFGQINLILMALVMLGFLNLRNSFLCGMFIGLAAAIKLTPAIFIVYLLLTRRTGAAMSAILTFLITVIIGISFLPSSSQQYWTGLFLNTGRIGDVRLIGDQSLNGTLSRISGNIISARPYWFLSSALIAITGLCAAVNAGKKQKEFLGILLCAFTGLLISPFSWSHHWVWLVLLILYLMHQMYVRPSVNGKIVLILLFIICGWFTPLIPNLSSLPHIIHFKPPKITMILLLQQNPYVVTGILFLLISAYNLFYQSNISKLLKLYSSGKNEKPGREVSCLYFDPELRGRSPEDVADKLK